MSGTKSHLSWSIGALIAVPVSIALAGSFWIATQALRTHEIQTQHMKSEEVRSQSRLLAENIWDQIDEVKFRAIASWQSHGLALAKGNGIKTIRELRLTEDGRIQEADGVTKQVSLREVRETGASLVRIPGNDDLGIAFFAQENPERLVFVTVNPVEVFSRFTRWAPRREGGNLRGYLIGADGKVIVHSERVYSGADFSGSEIFQSALRPLFHDERTGGIANFRSVDLRPVLTSYLRLANLPYAVVVERVSRVEALSGPVLLNEVLIPGVLLIALCLVAGIFAMLAIQRIATPASQPFRARVSADFDLPFVNSEIPSTPVPETAPVIAPPDRFL